MQIKQLEAQAGAPLLKRTSRSVELTPEGSLLLGKARRALEDLDSGLAEIRAAALARNGVVTLASSPSVASTLLPSVLARFGIEHPLVTVRVQELGAKDTMQAVGELRVDLGIGPTVLNASDFQFTPLLQDELCVLVPSKHALAQRTRVTLAQLQPVPCVMLSSFAAMRTQFENAATSEGVRITVQYEVQQMHTLMAMVAAGLGVGIAPRISVGAAATLPIKVLALASDQAAREISIITARGASQTIIAMKLIDLLQTMAKHWRTA